MDNSFESFVRGTMEITKPGALRQYFVDFMNARGFDIISYHYLLQGFKKLPVTAGVRIARLPGSWVREYFESNLFDIDPIRLEALRRGAPFTWRDVAGREDLTSEQKAFMRGLRDIGVRDGIALPVYSRPGDMAHFCLATTAEAPDFSNLNLLEHQACCQHMHIRFNEILASDQSPGLSQREVQVLELIAKGKSNTAISSELEISANTVDTLVRRCFEKLRVTSRIEAVLAGVSQGAILP